MKLKISAALVCLLLTHPVAAQSVKTLAREYISLPAVQDTFMDVQSPDYLIAFILADLPPGAKMSPAKKEAISKVAASHVAKMKPAMENALIEAAARSYTVEELEALIAFAKTEVGASATRKGAVFAQKFNTEFRPTIRRTQAAIRPEIMKILVQ